MLWKFYCDLVLIPLVNSCGTSVTRYKIDIKCDQLFTQR